MQDPRDYLMKQKLMQFMYGRNGFDLYSRFLTYLALLLWLLSIIIKNTVGTLLYYAGIAAIIYCYFRVFSKNLTKRRAENAKYYQQRTKVVNGFRNWSDRRKQSKSYKFFRCPSCKAMLRVPRGKGKIRITCRKCGSAFEKKT